MPFNWSLHSLCFPFTNSNFINTFNIISFEMLKYQIMKTIKFWKLIEHFSSTIFVTNPVVDESQPKSICENNQTSNKRITRFKNQKVLPLLFFIQLVAINFSFGNNSTNLDGCTIDVAVSVLQNVTNPGCAQGTAIITPNTVENYAWEIKPTFNLSLNAGSSLGSFSQGGVLVGTSLMAGDYIVEIETESGCTGAQTFTITQPPCNAVTPIVTYSNSSVNGAFDASLNFNFEAGNSCTDNWTYLLKWNGLALNFGDLGEPSSIPGPLQGTVNNLPAGNYELNVNPGGSILYPSACVGSTAFTITEPPCDMNFISTVTHETANSCHNAQISLDITGESRAGIYLVKITDPDNIDLIFYATETNGEGWFYFGNLSPGSYMVSVLNNDDPNSFICSHTEVIIIEEPICDIALSNLTVSNSIANGCNTGTFSIDISGNTCSDYYLAELSLNGTPYAINYPPEANGMGSFAMSSLPPGNYTLNVNNGAACVQSQNFTITEPACNLNLSNLISTNITNFGCDDGTLNIDLAGTTCSNYYTINIYRNTVLYSTYYAPEISGIGQLNVTALPTGNYQITVNDGSSTCEISETFNISEPACNTAIANFASNNPTINIGNNGSITFDAQGSSCNAYYYYELYQNGSLYTYAYIPESGISSPALVSNLPAGNYELKLFSTYLSTCTASQTFVLSNSPCNLNISNLTVNNLSSVGCANGGISCNLSGSTVYGLYFVTLNKDGIFYANYNVTPSGIQTPFTATLSDPGNYELIVSDGSTVPCTANANFSITQQACSIQINNPIVNEETTSQQTVIGSVSGSISGASCDGNYLVNLIQTDGSILASQTIPVSNPNFLFENLTAGIYSIKAYPGIVNEACLDQYDFILIDPCPVSNVAFVIDSTAGPCTFSTVHVSVTGTADPSKLYSVEYRLDGGPWTVAHGPYFGHVGAHTFDMYLSVDGYYEFRSGPLVVLPTCPIVSGLSIYKKYCDAYQTSTTVTNASNDCSNGAVNIFFTDPIKCLATFYTGKILQAGIEIANLNFTPVIGNNYVAMAQLMPGNYSYTIYTEGDIYGGGIGCPLNGTFSIGNDACNLTISNEVIDTTCTGSNYAAQVNGITCNGNYLVELYKDGSIMSSSSITEYSSSGYISFSNLQTGNYVLKVFSNHLNPGNCVAIKNFDVNIASCNLAINNVVVTNAAADLSTYGSVNFNVSGTECYGYQVTLKKNGIVYFSNNFTPTGTLTPVNFSSLPPDNYEIIFSNGVCEVTQFFTILQGNISCNLSYTALTSTEVTTNGGTDGTINFTLNGNTCGAGQYEIEVYKNAILLQSSNVIATGSSTNVGLTNLPAGNIQILVYNGCMNGANECAITFSTSINEPQVCDLQVSVSNYTNPSIGCQNGNITVNLQGNANGNNYILSVSKDGNSVYNAGYASSSAVTDVIPNIPAGNYVITLSYAGSGACFSAINFTLNSLPCNLTIADVVTTQACDNSNDGAVAFDVNGTICQISALQLLSASGTVLVNTTINQSEGRLFEDLFAGNYSIQVTTPSGCSANYPFTIEPQCDLSLFNETVSLEGAGNCTTAKLSYFVNANYCSASLVKLINNIDMTIFYQSNLPNQDGIDANEITNIPVGDYTLKVLNSSGNCSASYNFVVAPAPCSNIQFSNVTLGESSLGCAWAFGYDLNLGNCPGSLLTLSKNGNLENSYFLNSTVSTEINNLSNGNYNLHLYTASGCVIDYPFEVNPVCNLAISNSITTQSCDSYATGDIAFDLSGNICNNTPLYLLDNSGNIITSQMIDSYGNYTFNDLLADSYALQLTNQAGCSVNYPFTIEPECDLSLFNETVSLEGAGNCTTAKLSYFVNASFCSAAIVKLVDNTDMTVFYQSNIPNQDGIDANEIANIPVGNYTLIVSNNSGNCSASYNFVVAPAPCSNIQFSNITINPSPTDGCYYNFGYDLVLGNCPGSLLTLNQNGSIIETYNLIGNISTEIPELTPGNYYLHLNSAGCEIDYPFEITPAACNINITNASVSSTGVLYCVNGRIDFDVIGTTCGTGAVALVQNGNILNTINWTTGNGEGLHFDNMSPGNYSIIAVNNLFNVTCGDTLDFTINSVLPPLSISNVSVNSTGVLACTNGNVSFVVNGQFCANSYVIVYDESVDIVYSANYNNGGNQSYNVSGLVPGNYTIEFGLIGYSVTETFTISPNSCNLAITNVQVSTLSGANNCTVASVSFTPTGDMCSNGSVFLFKDGNAIDFHLWPMNTAPNLVFNNLTPGNYVISAATGSYGYCSTSINFEVLPTPCSLNIANATSTPSNGSNGTIDVIGAGAYCGNITIALDAEITAGNYSNLSTNFGNISTQFSNLAPGNYRVTISSDGSTCTDVEYITVTGAVCNTNPIISASSTSICPGQTVILNSNYLTGNAWSNGGTSFNTNITSAGTYTLTVTELNGCTGSTSINITNGTNCVQATQMSNGVCGNMNFVKTSSITCLAVSGATQYEWQFSNGSGVYATKITTTNYVLLHSVSPAINWGTTWNIKVRVYVGVNVGPFSNNCNIGIMQDPTIGGVPLTQLRTQDCGKLNYRINADNRIIANPVTGAIQYEFEFSSSVTGLVVATKLLANNVLYLNTVTPALTFPAQYNVRVKAKIGNVWGVYGTPCLIGITGLNREEETSVDDNLSAIESIPNLDINLSVFPNPFNEQATIVVHSTNNENINLEVFDMVGNIVWKEIITSNKNTNFGIDFAQGTYLVKAINSSGNQAMFRFVKSK